MMDGDHCRVAHNISDTFKWPHHPITRGVSFPFPLLSFTHWFKELPAPGELRVLGSPR